MKPTTRAALCLLLVAARAAWAGDLDWFYKTAEYAALVDKCAATLKCAYMCGTLVSTSTSYPGWEGLPVQKWQYYTGTDPLSGQKKRGLVHMLNPSADRLARWVANACWHARRSVNATFLDQVVTQVKYQSGAQFPVCGIVYEDMDGGGYYPYAFKDGVTVYVADESKWATDLGKKGKYCTDEQLEYCCSLTNAQLKNYTGRYARICSTTREQYTAAGGTVDVGTSDSTQTRKIAWLGVVRDLYKKAWSSDTNELFDEWALASLK